MQTVYPVYSNLWLNRVVSVSVSVRTYMCVCQVQSSLTNAYLVTIAAWT